MYAELGTSRDLDWQRSGEKEMGKRLGKYGEDLEQQPL